jgi:rubrerythrin
MKKPMPIRASLEKLVLEKAMIFEEHAYRCYSSMLGRTVMSESFDLLKRVLGLRLQTFIILKEMQKNIRAVNIELVRPQADTPGPPADTDLKSLCREGTGTIHSESPDSVLRNALRQEQCARVFYGKLISHTRHSDVYSIFQRRIDEAEQLIGEIKEKLRLLHGEETGQMF